MLRVVICEDEKETRRCLAELIRRQSCPCEITEYASAEECLWDEQRIDLLFLDIELDASGVCMGGMALAQEIRRQKREAQPIIIFVTGYERYVYDAFDVDAFQYLLKPVDEEKFAEVFARAAKRAAVGRKTAQKVRRITVKVDGMSRSLPSDQIYFIESSNHKAVFHLKEEEFACYTKIGDLEEKLKDCFFRIHRGYLVNLACVEQYSRTEAVLINGERLLISKYKYRDFVRAYLRFLKEEAGL